MDMKELKIAFETQRRSAGNRGIGWNLTFEQWLGKWVESGKLAERGKGKDEFCMSREGDKGDYEIGNVFIQTNSQNSIDAHKGKPRTDATKKKLSDYWIGIEKSDAAKKNMSAAKKGKTHPKVSCRICRKELGWRHLNKHFTAYHSKASSMYSRDK